MGKFTDRIQEAQAHMKTLQAKIADANETAQISAMLKKDEIEDKLKSLRGDMNAAEENARLKSEEAKSKFSADLLKAQMVAESIKSKVAEKKENADKKHQKKRIGDLLDYAEECQVLAATLAVEAEIALLEAAAETADYVEVRRG